MLLRGNVGHFYRCFAIFCGNCCILNKMHLKAWPKPQRQHVLLLTFRSWLSRLPFFAQGRSNNIGFPSPLPLPCASIFPKQAIQSGLVLFANWQFRRNIVFQHSPAGIDGAGVSPERATSTLPDFLHMFFVFWHLHLLKPASFYYHACDWRRVSENNIHLSWNLFTHCPNPHPIIRHVSKRTYSNVASSMCSSAREGTIA